MRLTGSLTVDQIVSRVAVESGLEYRVDPFASTDQAFKQLINLLQVAGEELVIASAWSHLVRLFEPVTAPANDGVFDLPDDYLTLLDGTGWNSTSDARLHGPLSPQQWQAELNNVTSSSGDVYAFRILRSQLHVLPKPPPYDEILSFEYQSRDFVLDSITGLPKDSITSGGDIINFDRTLISRMLKLKWQEAKGFDTSASQASLNQVFSNLVGKDKGGGTINAGLLRGGARLLDNRNIPDTGYGQ